jgi:hypothetical protein
LKIEVIKVQFKYYQYRVLLCRIVSPKIIYTDPGIKRSSYENTLPNDQSKDKRKRHSMFNEISNSATVSKSFNRKMNSSESSYSTESDNESKCPLSIGTDGNQIPPSIAPNSSPLIWNKHSTTPIPSSETPNLSSVPLTSSSVATEDYDSSAINDKISNSEDSTDDSFKTYSYEEMLELGQRNKFPKRKFKFLDVIKSFTVIFHYWDCDSTVELKYFSSLKHKFNCKVPHCHAYRWITFGNYIIYFSEFFYNIKYFFSKVMQLT